MRIKILFFAAALLLSPLAFANTAVISANLPPDRIIEQSAHAMFAAMHGHAAEYQKDPQKLYGMIGRILLPHFDFDFASRLVLGLYWRSATPAQREAFEDAFYKYLIHSYADGLLKGNYSERNIQVEPWHGNPGDTRAMVRSRVLRDNGPPIQVDYAMVHTKNGWQVFDVTIEGISYVMNYRNQFGPEIQQTSLDALIKRLNADAVKGPAQHTGGGGS